jgi:2-polyprenyl-6-methoxyphenol hydroxylase-like FAD-dependent oxidoreductase
MNDWDVIVVGGRAAGAATSLLLARAGLRVLCVERSRRGSDTVSTHALMRGGVLQLQRWGVLPAVVAAGTPAVRTVSFHYGDDEVGVTLRPAAGVDALYAPRRTLVDRLLADAAEAAGAQVRHGTSVVGLELGPGPTVVGARLRGPDGDVRVERARVVVGADGRFSSVAREVGAATRRSADASSAFLYGYWHGSPVEGYHWLYAPGAAAGAIPTNDGLTCAFVAASPAVLDGLVRGAGTEGALHALAAATGLDRVLGEGRRVGGLRHVRGQPGYLRAAWGPGWALVGDAGYWKDPMSTHGLTDAFRDAELLARAVVAAPAPGRAQRRALAEFECLRDELSLQLFEVSSRIAGYDWNVDEVRDLVRTLSAAMSDEVDLLASLPAAA